MNLQLCSKFVKWKRQDYYLKMDEKIIKFINYCQAQSQLQVKLSLKTELALFPLNPHICGPCSSKYVATAPPDM